MSKISFTTQAKDWYEALPLGNGRLGAMIYGRIGVEEIQLNEETVWYGGERDRINPDAYPHLDQVRRLIHDGEITKAQTLIRQTFSGMPNSMYPYQSLGNVYLRILNEQTDLADYGKVLDLKEEQKDAPFYRELDLEDALYHQKYALGADTGYRRSFISIPDNVLVYELSYEHQPISLEVRMERERYYESVQALVETGIMMRGHLGEDGLRFGCAITAIADGGSIEVLGENLIVRDAHKVTLLITAGTTYPERISGKEERADVLDERLQKRLRAAVAKGASALLQDHLEAYHALFDRVHLSLPEAPEVERFFDYGRYLLIASSYGCELPANLMGIWNPEMTPPWDSKFTININTEMNYWPAEVCGLPECHMVLLRHVKKLCANGQRTAQKMYHCRGSVAHHNTDIWGDTAPQDLWIPGTYWVMGLAWLCQHIGVHYRYTKDTDFIREYLPVLEQAVWFFMDYTTMGDDGMPVISPSVSPENTYILDNGEKGSICENSTMDVEILRELLRTYIEAVDALGGAASQAAGRGMADALGDLPSQHSLSEATIRLYQQAGEMLEHLPPLQIGKHGQIMEWQQDYDEAEPGHRHVSQLFGLFPGRDINRYQTPELAQAAAATLERRLKFGGGHTGWSAAWITLFYVEIGKSGDARSMLHKLLRDSTAPNLMDTHPRGDSYVFQIDGNLGACAAIARMIVQCRGEDVYLLPTLPKDMLEGCVQGLRLYGNAVLNLTWKDGRIMTGQIMAHSDYTAILHWDDQSTTVRLQAGEIYSFPSMK